MITGIPELQMRLIRPGYSGLTDREATVLDALVRRGGASREVLALRRGLPVAELAASLERLESLGYATVTEANGGTYLAVAQAGG